jgi:hypothetical protein
LLLKAFGSDASTDVFDERDIDRERRAFVIFRPDQYVTHVLPLQRAHAYCEADAIQSSSVATPAVAVPQFH